MNVGNTLGSRPSIRLYPGVSSGGIFGGSDATAIHKQVKRAAPKQETIPVAQNVPGLSQRVVQDQQAPIGSGDQNSWGQGHRILPDRHADKPLGGEVEAGYGIGERILPERHADKPLGGEIEAGYGIGNRIIPGLEQDTGASANGAAPVSRRKTVQSTPPADQGPDWMSRLSHEPVSRP